MLRTRFTLGFLIMISFFIVYDFFISLSVPFSSNSTSVLIGITFFLFLLNMLIFFGTFGGSKSDRDFLFALPLPKRSLVFSMYVTRFLSIGIVFVFVAGYIIPNLHVTAMDRIVVIANIVLASLLLTAIATAATTMPISQKVATSAVFSIWGILAVPNFHFQYSYLSSLSGSTMTGTVLIIAVSIPMNFIALKRVYEVELGSSRTGFMSSSEVKGKAASFSTTPARSILKFYFSNINVSGRTNMGGNVTVTARGFKLRNGVIFTAVASVLYFFIAVRSPDSIGDGFNTVVFLATGYMGAFAPLVLCMGVISFERSWLAFVILPPGYYMKNLIAAKILQVFVLLLPFTAASVALQLYGVNGAINSPFVSGIMAPAATEIFLFLSTKLTVVQIKDTEMMPARYSLRQTVQVLPAVALFFVAFISAVLFEAALICTAAIIAISLYISLNPRIWQKSVVHLTERGFI